MLIATADDFAARRRALDRELDFKRLALRLRQHVSPLLEQSVYFSEQKALLSSDGGVCPQDGARLVFDPASPTVHRCPHCGESVQGERHHRAWLWRYHIWLSERVIHLAVLAGVQQDAACAARALDVLELYATRYGAFPNRDNVLGPTRLFFSTYLESIWLLQLVIGASFLKASRGSGEVPHSPSAHFDGMVAESAGLIGSFDEGWSNRQVWNNAALLAAGLWLNEQSLVDVALDGPHGLRAQLVRAVSDEGMWFEGENYHFFALRGFLLAAELLRPFGVDLYGDGGPANRLADMYVAPLRTVLPDLTVPARGDAPFGVSLRQPRFAELWEVGWARTGDPRLESVLCHLYALDATEREDPGFAEMAEQEVNRPPQRLSRRLLGWKSLLWMRSVVPQAPPELWQAGSAVLQDSGLAIVRSAPNRYLSIECGGHPGGHGHPDLLHLSLYWHRPVLADFGTASYVSASLHWYRSTLAHNAPGVSGRGQSGRTSWCAAFDTRDRYTWCRCVAEDVLGENTRTIRTVVVSPGGVLDLVDVHAPDETTIDLPIHPMEVDRPTGTRTFMDDVLGEVAEAEVRDGAELKAGDCRLLLLPREGERLLVVERPGPPDDQFADGTPLPFLVRRARGPGQWVQWYGLSADAPAAIQRERDGYVLQYGDATHEHIAVGAKACHIRDRAGASTTLTGIRSQIVAPPRLEVRLPHIPCPLLSAMPLVGEWERQLPSDAVHELGAPQYRRSEESHGVAGDFRARVGVFAVDRAVCFAVDVTKHDLHFRRAVDPDPGFDNETPDIHSDGLQCYVGGAEWRGILAIPEPDTTGVRVKRVGGAAADPSTARGTWSRTDRGYRMVVSVDVGRSLERGDEVPVNLVVNEMYEFRERRAGQLVLSGGGGWVYLRGDREYPDSAVIAEVT